MELTPTARGQFLAGIGLWAVLWSLVLKLDTLMKALGFSNIKVSKRMLDWCGHNRVLTLLGTEGVNGALHGINSPDAVMFNLGGTVFNIFVVCGLLSIRKVWSR